MSGVKDWIKVWKDPALRKRVERGRELAGKLTKLVVEHPELLDHIGDDEIITDDTYRRLRNSKFLPKSLKRLRF